MREFINLSQLGKRYRVTSHVMGKWLVECGLRERRGNLFVPSQKAHAGGFVQVQPSGNGAGCNFLWHQTRTEAALADAGHHPVATATSSLKGPYFVSKRTDNCFEIVDADGTVGVWAFGKERAEQLVTLLNASTTG